MKRKTADTIPVLSDAMETILTNFASSETGPETLVKRANIILLAAQGTTNQEIARRVGMHYNRVATWRTRYLQELPHLREVEEEEPALLESEIRRVLSDLEHPGAPAKLTREQRLKIIEIACQSPREFGYDADMWSIPLLTREILVEGIADEIYPKTVSCFLNEAAMRPYKMRFEAQAAEKKRAGRADQEKK